MLNLSKLVVLVALLSLSGCSTASTSQKHGGETDNPTLGLAIMAASPFFMPLYLPSALAENAKLSENIERCYWMGNGGLAGNSFVVTDNTGQPIWNTTDIRTKAECYDYNGCGEGRNGGNGGCYKWATSATAPALPW